MRRALVTLPRLLPYGTVAHRKATISRGVILRGCLPSRHRHRVPRRPAGHADDAVQGGSGPHGSVGSVRSATRAEGRAMTPEQAVAYALDEQPSA